jgi:hypothetical protein
MQVQMIALKNKQGSMARLQNLFLSQSLGIDVCVI